MFHFLRIISEQDSQVTAHCALSWSMADYEEPGEGILGLSLPKDRRDVTTRWHPI